MNYMSCSGHQSGPRCLRPFYADRRGTVSERALFASESNGPVPGTGPRQKEALNLIADEGFPFVTPLPRQRTQSFRKRTCQCLSEEELLLCTDAVILGMVARLPRQLRDHIGK